MRTKRIRACVTKKTEQIDTSSKKKLPETKKKLSIKVIKKNIKRVVAFKPIVEANKASKVKQVRALKALDPEKQRLREERERKKVERDRIK